MSCRIRFAMAAGALVLLPGSASAHIQLVTPLQRDVDQKVGPCGANGVRSANVCEYRPGARITVSWEETVEHPGHFRISFDEDGEDDFITPSDYDDIGEGDSILVDGIADQDTRSGDSGYGQEVLLPDVECDNCTLQLIQIMTDKPPYGDGNDIYYQCADIVLSASAPADPADACSAGDGDDGGGNVGGGGDGGGGEESGCAAAGSGAGGRLAWLLPLLVAGLVRATWRRPV